ncbi:lipase family protein [Novipirellula rosea]|uniref:Lipase family protein n=1 Tax=Novipirellula rosea TaxID=1031540 RepID=A0ABP8MW94_9BACT|tara:strand:+ start:6767 stop:7783 length:1017 start_codon:yes stop_codon:yes gene_type:complete
MIEETVNNLISDPGEVAFVVHSKVRGPIRDLTFLQRALLFAELSMIAYNDEDEARRAAKIAGFDDVTFYDRDGSQAYRFRNDFDCVIACRGTEPNEWNDIQADANAASVVAETIGKVHRGFKREVDDLWPMIETALMSNEQPLWFCGHSLGGAMATICSGRCFLSHIQSNPEQLYTYGSPRVGDNRYVNYVALDHFRFVNNNDIVTRVPPLLLGYRHCGSEVYIDRNGRLGRLNLLMKRRDRWWGFIHGLRRWKIDHFADHSIHNYIAAIFDAVRAEQVELGGGGIAKSGSEYAGDEREYTEEERVDLPHLKPRTTTPAKQDKSSADGLDSNEMRIQG